MARSRDVTASLVLLALVLGIALVGLAADGNWPKVVRVAAAGMTYAAALAAGARVTARDRVASAGTPFLPFVLAGALAGIVSGVLRPVVQPAVVATGALAAGVLLGGVHFIALRHWARVRGTAGLAVPAAPQR